MNLLEGLSDLQGNALTKVLRRTILSALMVGAVAVLLTAFLGSLWGALGLIIGLGLAIVNLRFLDAGIAKLKPQGEVSISNKVLRRAMGTKSVTRLGIITVICVGLLLLNGALGIGAVAGLVIFQLLFVVNVGRIVMSQGIQ
ncbi:MAG TPA: hypothetical protein VK773_09370 [Acidimicrobiales bacterium]|nr:hypothetical protein [Acidimicrobiales bacterium]